MDHPGVAALCILAPVELNRSRTRFADRALFPRRGPRPRPTHQIRSHVRARPPRRPCPRQWAGVIVDAMEAAARDSKPRFREAKVGFWFCQFWMRITAEDRNHGRLEDSRQNVERLVELGKALSSRYPDQAESFVVLSNGYLDRHKIAWKEADYPAIERHLTQAVEAARQAVAVDPANQDAGPTLSVCQQRLDDFLKGRRQAASQVR